MHTRKGIGRTLEEFESSMELEKKSLQVAETLFLISEKNSKKTR